MKNHLYSDTVAKPDPVDLLGQAVQACLPGARVERLRDQACAIRHPGGGILPVVLEAPDAVRLAQLEGLIGRHALIYPGFDRALALVLPRLTRATTDHVVGFLRDHAPRMPVLLLSWRGGAALRIPVWQQEAFRADPTARRDRGARPAPGPAFHFSDSSEWLLKILLMAECPGDWWQGPRDLVGTGSELARVAGVAPSTTSRFLRAIDALGWLGFDERRRRLRIRNPREVLATWLDHAQLDPPRATSVRSSAHVGDLREPANLLEWCRGREDPGVAVAVAGWPALDLHQALHVSGEPTPMLLTDDPATLMRRWRLSPSDGPGDLVLLRSATPRRSFAGAARRNAVPVVDVWEAQLNVAGDRVRARAQAEWLVPELARLGGSEADP